MSATQESAPPAHGKSLAYRYYVLALLTAVYTFNFIDRQIIAILSPSIKAELGLADWQLGILKGFAFAVFYTMLGIPIARLADRFNRVTIISISLATWSGFTAISGAAQNFSQLALARIGVGVGEAGGSPPAHSLISDYFPKEKRAGAIAIYAMGIPIGVSLAYLFGGWLAAEFSWRIAFIVIGLPGVVLAVLLKLTVREAPRGGVDGTAPDAFRTEDETGLGFWAIVKKDAGIVWRAAMHLLSIPTYRFFTIAAASVSFTGYAVFGWLVIFYTRVHPEFPVSLVLFWLGIIAGTAYVAGTFLGGYVVDNLAARDKRAYGFTPALALFLCVPLIWGLIWTGNPVLSLVLQAPVHLALGFYLGPTFALAQTLAPVSVRALSTAILFFIINLIGLGLGPTLTGFLSSALTPAYGDITALRLALTAASLGGLVGAFMFYLAGRRTPEDWARATGEN